MSSIETDTLTVSQYASHLSHAVRAVGGAVIEGEVQRPNPRDNGMLFFDLTDGDATLSCKVFSRQAHRLTYRPKEGDLVQAVVERPDFWPVRGALSLIVADIELAGEGELLRRRDELRTRLKAEGLADPERRKPLPRFPRAVGVIAGKDSHAMADVIQALQDRFPPVRVFTCGSLVQGSSAPRALIDAVARMELHPLVDVIVIARGGGSVRDLVAFDDEGLCRAIFGAGKPIVTAIGHTDNTPVCNDVGYAAYTPSRSAELVVPSAAELCGDLHRLRERLADVHASLRRDAERVAVVRERLDIMAAINAWDSHVRAHARETQIAEHAFFSARERGLIEARSILDQLRHQLPAVSEIATEAAELDARAAKYFADRERELADAWPGLARVPDQFDERAAGVAEQGRRVVVGTRRQLADHDRDYQRALQRLLREMAAGIGRRQAMAEREVSDHGRRIAADVRRRVADHEREHNAEVRRAVRDIRADAMSGIERAVEDIAVSHNRARELVGRRLADAERDLRHGIELIEARDFRLRGWILATDMRGRAVRSVTEIERGSRLNLTFRDGRAESVIDRTQEDTA
jgi:exodeoxyribonuclease VII large subunit